MEENKRTELDKINEKKEIMTPKDYRSIFWRSFTIQGSWSFDKMMAYGYMYAIESHCVKYIQMMMIFMQR